MLGEWNFGRCGGGLLFLRKGDVLFGFIWIFKFYEF